MPNAPRRRRLSRKGCVSCKRLKIKCNEGKPACEYCLHRGRVCIYPQEAPSNSGKDLVTVKDSKRITSSSLRVHSFNSTQVQLNVTRFEYRLLRFFNDHCVQIFTFNNNPRADHIWRRHLPSYFGVSPVMRQAVFAFASLNLWPITNLRAILADDEGQSGSSFHTPLEYNIDDLSHVLEQLSIDSESDSSILDRTNVFFDNVVKSSAAHIREAVARGIEYADVATIYLSTTLTFTYIGLHPHCIMPLVDFEHDPPSDLLSYSRSIHNMMRHAPPGVYEALLHRLTEFTFADPQGVKYHVIKALNDELDRHYLLDQQDPVGDELLDGSDFSVPVSEFVGFDPETFNSGNSSTPAQSTPSPNSSNQASTGPHTQATPGSSIYELDSQTSMEIETFRKSIAVFETCFHTSIVTNFPIPLYKLLPFLNEEFSELTRAKNPFALRMLLLYSLFCLYGHFYIQRQNNVWAQYIGWYVQNQTLSDFDTILYNYVVLQDREVDNSKIAACFGDVDMLFKDYSSSPAEPFDAFGEYAGHLEFGTEIDAIDENLFSKQPFMS